MDSGLVSGAKAADLLTCVRGDLHSEGKRQGQWWLFLCPFHRDETPSLGVNPSTQSWHCFGCGKGGDVIQWRREFHAETFADAVQSLAGGLAFDTARPFPPAETIAHHGPPCAQWQARARAIIAEAEAALWSPTGAQALAWLRARGLADETIRRAQLGYIPKDTYETAEAWGLTEKAIYLPRGVVIPCEAGGAIWYLKIRRPVGQPKYTQARGGRPALYLADSLIGQTIGVFTEGEFDALLLWQEAGDVAGMATLGSASNRLDVGEWGLYLLPLVHRLLAYDADNAGANGAAALAWLKGARRIMPNPLKPGDKDLTDYHVIGGSLRQWLLSELKIASGSPTRPVPGLSGHLIRPADVSESLWAAMTHSAYIPHLPIVQQPAEVEAAWWAQVFAERGLADPAGGK